MRQFPSKKIIVIQLNTLNFKWISDANWLFLSVSRIIWNVVEIRLAQIIYNIDLTFLIIVIISNTLTIIYTPHFKQILLLAIRRRNYYIGLSMRCSRVKRRSYQIYNILGFVSSEGSNIHPTFERTWTFRNVIT